MNALSSSMFEESLLGVGLGGDGEGVPFLDNNFHLADLLSSMSSHPDLSSSCGGEVFTTRWDVEPPAASA